MGYGREGNSAADDELIKWHADELYQKYVQEQDKSKQNEGEKEEKNKDN